MAILDALSGDPYGASGALEATIQSPQIEENKSMWRNVLAKLNDPNVRQALVQTGVGLLQSPQYGQNSGDVIANALNRGVTTLQGLRNMDYERNQKAQTRQDTLRQQQTENTQAQQRIDISGNQQNTYAQQVGDQRAASLRTDQREGAQLAETTRHNKADEATRRIAAEADRTRANAYGAVGNRVPAEVQKINALAAQFEAEGQDPVAARARAVMVVDSTGKAKSPGDQAAELYKAKIAAWSNNIENFGKQLTPDQARMMLNESMNDVMAIGRFNQTATGAAPPAASPPARPGQGGPGRSPSGSPNTTPTSSAVGTVKAGYKKIKQGPDTDKSTWQKVNGGK